MAKKKQTKSTKAEQAGAAKPVRRGARVKELEAVSEAAQAAAPEGATPAAPRVTDPRIPPPGTVIEKRDRQGATRCKCTVEEDGGIRYAGKLYKSLSAAAMAAAKDLGLTNKTQNGFTFWGLSKPPRPPTDALVALERAWERYHGNVVALVKEGVTDENRSKVVAAISNHAQVIESLREKVA